MTTISQRIAQFTSGLTWTTLPPHVREKCKVSMLHNLGVALAGAPLLEAPERYAQALGEAGATANARLLISGRPATPDTAAFVNAALMHARAQDDVYFAGLTHAGSVMTPAVLACAEAIDASGSDVATALAAGYEAAAALSEGFGVRTSRLGFRPTGVYGVFASTVGVAHLLKLDAAATANAIGIACNLAGGVSQAWIAGTREWQLHVGIAARNGVLAARLAAAGERGAPDALEGAAGFYRAFAGGADGAQQVGRDLGTRWRSLDVTYKPYAVCAILQSPVTHAIRLAREHDLAAGDITAVRLHLPPAEAAYPGTDCTGPYADFGSTLMSAQFCLAVALAERRARAQDLKRFADPVLQPLIERSRVVPDASLGPRSYVLEIERSSGASLRHEETSGAEPFNWNRDEVLENLRNMQEELPLSAAGLAQLGRIVLDAERHSARDIVSACIC